MDTELEDAELIARLRRIEASAGTQGPAFGYETLLERHGAKQARARRRHAVARGTASVLVVALVAASLWRFERGTSEEPVAQATAVAATGRPQSRIVRADNYLPVATLEDHIASFDDALNDARAHGGEAEVARLERTRDELLDSYAQVRYAQLVSANF